MLAERWRLIEKLVMDAWDVPSEERSAFIRARCGDDSDLEAEVRSLLEAQAAADAWSAPTSAPAAAPERRAGPYRLLRLIGRGGMGAVYLGQRADEHFEQQVAVKVFHLAFEGDPLHERFRQERQILAGLNHPNIAHLVDGGTTSDGGLYIAMEYVDGLPLDKYCEERKLSLHDRITLFLTVCDAVSFAHRNLVVHRDLKPSNILVTREGQPKLLDFGTSRILSAEAAATATMPLMTPRYASPEQLRGAAMTTTTDVYSLGVILSELLSERKLSGDLATVLTKALEPDPLRRYGSVAEFAADLERYRSGRPVLARPQTFLYSLRKFVARNRLGVAAAAVLLLAVAAGILSTLWQARRAERMFADVRQLASYLVFDIHDGLQQLPGATSLQLQAVERSMAYLDRLSQEASADSALRLEVAEGYKRLGDVIGGPFRPSLGDRTRAAETYRKALAAGQAVLTAEPQHLHARRAVASIRLQQAGLAGFGGNTVEAREQMARAVAELRSICEQAPEDVDARLALAGGLEVMARQWNAGGGLLETTDAAKAAALYDEAVAQLQYARERRPTDTTVPLQLAFTEMSAGNLYGSSEPAAAIRRYESALAWLRQLPPERSNRLDVRRVRASVLQNIGWAQGQIGAYAEAVSNIDASAELLEALAAVDPDNANAQYQVTSALRARGLVHTYDKNYAEAVRDFTKAAEIHRRLSEKDPGNGVYRYLRAELMVRLGNLHTALHQAGAARAAAASGLATLEELASKPKPNLTHIFGACRWFAETDVVALRDASRAERFCLNAVERTDGKDLDAWQGVGAARALRGDRRGAVEAGERALALLPPARPGEPTSQQRQTLETALAKWKQIGGGR